MLITNYAVIKLVRDAKRQWTILGQTNDIPGECRPGMIYPIVAVTNDHGQVIKTKRTHSYGWIDPREEFGYIKMNFWTRMPHAEEVLTEDRVVIDFVKG